MATTDSDGNVFYDDGDINVVGPHGDTLFTNDPDADGSGGFSGPIVDYINMGVLNGSFPLGPGQGLSTSIGSNNTMPYWSGLHVVSGSSISATWERDSSGTDYNLRFTMAAGAASDEAYVEQIVRVPHSKAFTVVPSALFYGPTALIGTAGSALAYISAQFLQSDGVTTTGAAVTSTASLTTIDGGSGDLWNLRATYPNTTGVVPLDATFLRVRIGLDRDAAATSAAGSVDVTDVHLIFGDYFGYITDADDAATYGPTRFYQNGGLFDIAPGSGTHTAGTTAPYLRLDLRSGGVTLYALDGTFLPEIAAPGTPASGYYAIYPKTDGIIYGKNDAGTETALGGVRPVLRPAISGTVNDYAPTGLAPGVILAPDLGGANRIITGIAAQSDGAAIYIQATTAFTITLSHLDAASSAANQITCPGGVSYTVSNKAGVVVWYDATDALWRVLDK